jgi:hypothetical protein
LDLSFTFYDRPAGLVPGPGSTTAMLLDAAARQGGSATALIQAGLQATATTEVTAGLFDPSHGSFNPRVAARLARWGQR